MTVISAHVIAWSDSITWISAKHYLFTRSRNLQCWAIKTLITKQYNCLDLIYWPLDMCSVTSIYLHHSHDLFTVSVVIWVMASHLGSPSDFLCCPHDFPGMSVVTYVISSQPHPWCDCRHEERKSAMLSLIKLTREGMFGLWDDHFNTILLILLETLGDDDVSHTRVSHCIV